MQVAKLLIIPFVCLVERCWLGRVFTKPVIFAVLTVVTGVAIVYALPAAAVTRSLTLQSTKQPLTYLMSCAVSVVCLRLRQPQLLAH